MISNPIKILRPEDELVTNLKSKIMIAEKRSLVKWREAKEINEEPSLKHESEWVAKEITLSIVVNGHKLLNFSSSPIDCCDLAVGFLFTEGIISKISDIENLDEATNGLIVFTLIKELQFNCRDWLMERTVTSGCGQGMTLNLELKLKDLAPTHSSLKINASYITGLFSNLKYTSHWYEKTDCIHHAALISQSEQPIIREDIGRHNAVDKVIGAGLMSGFGFSNSIISCSGRISSDIMLKAGRAGIPFVISRAAPTSLAVDIANELDITLIGFARSRRMNIYSCPKRICSEGVKDFLEINEENIGKNISKDLVEI